MKKIISILIITFFITGCVKMNASMKVNKNKSMDYEIILAFDKSLVQNNNIISDEDITEAKNNGYIINEYNDDTKTGIKVSKHIKNIDSVSTTKETITNLNEYKNIKFFTVKKGFVKNAYKAKFYINTNYQDNTDLLITDNVGLDDYNNMEMKFEVTLPYKAISTNAQNVNDKTLSWDMTSFTENYIEFEFELYNYQNIIIIAVILFIVLIIIIVILNIIGKRKNNDDSTNNNSNTSQFTIEQNQNLNVQPTNNQNNIWTQPSTEQPINNSEPSIWEQPVYNQDNLSTQPIIDQPIPPIQNQQNGIIQPNNQPEQPVVSNQMGIFNQNNNQN